MLARSSAQFLTHCDSTRGHQIDKPDLFDPGEIDLIRVPEYEIANRWMSDPVGIAALGLSTVCSTPRSPQHIPPIQEPTLCQSTPNTSAR